ncbi:hypothetical protein ACLMAJ_13920 [Nocardia sp. KC 131]
MTIAVSSTGTVPVQIELASLFGVLHATTVAGPADTDLTHPLTPVFD